MADRILITGGTGFLGRHLISHLLAEGYELRLIVRQPGRVEWLNAKPVEIVQGDIRNLPDVHAASADCRFVIHAAAHFRFWGSPDLFHDVNVLGTGNVAKAALAHAVEKVVHISAIAVIGDPPSDGFIDESTVCHPKDEYQRSKRQAELNLLELARTQGLPAVVLRPGAFYGPYGRYGFNRLFVEDPLRGIRIMIKHGHHKTFPVYVPDVASAVSKALKKGTPGETYNICDRAVSHLRINNIVSELLGITPRRWNAPKPAMVFLAGLLEAWARLNQREPFYPLNLRHYVFHDWQVDSTKARRALGVEYTPLEDGLRETVAWYLTQDIRPILFRRRQI